MGVTHNRVDILLVDDSPANLRLLMDLIEGHNYDVRVANSGERALAAVRSSRPDLIMLDISMPEMDGYEVCRLLKADVATADIPIIFVSARDDGADKVQAFTVGGADYVTKPFQLVEILARIDHQLEISRLQRELARQNIELARSFEAMAEQNAELARKNEELERSHRTVDAIFSALSDALPGTVLADRYRLEGKIGAGRYGAVYKAVHLGMERPVAVRVLHPLTGAVTPEGLARFRSEGIAAYRIQHPNAVLMLDFGTTSSGIPYLVTEFLEGRTLADELDERGRLGLDRCAQILVPVCDVLAETHAAGLAHRDIRAANVFVQSTADGETIKVLDFGLATLTDESESGGASESNESDGIGSAVVETKRLEGQGSDWRSDIFGLGAMAYRMLTGESPPTGAEAVSGDRQSPTSMREIDPTIPAPIDAIVMQALSPDPARRPGAREFANQFVIALLSVSRHDESK